MNMQFNTNMKAVLLYGYETWQSSKSITTKLQVFINLVNTKHNLLNIRNQSVPRCKHFPPRL